MIDDRTSYGLLKTLENSPGLSQRDLAKRLGVSLGKVNYCLNALIEKGWLKVDNFRNSENKLAYAYLLTPQGVEKKACLTIQFLQMKIREYEHLHTEIAELKREVEQNSLMSIRSMTTVISFNKVVNRGEIEI